jgi:hypothetical protein
MDRLNLTYSIGNSPCKDCDDRHSHCHAECERYKAYRQHCDRIAKDKERERLSTPEWSRDMVRFVWQKTKK